MARLLKSNESRAVLALLLIIFLDALSYMITIPVFLRLLLDPNLAYLPTSMSTAMRNTLFSLIIAVGPLGYMIGAPIMGTWSDNIGRKRTLILSLILCCIGFALPIIGIVFHSLTLIIIGRVIDGFGSSSQSIAQSAIGDISKGKQKAWYFALVAIAMTLPLLIGPPMGGYLSDPNGIVGPIATFFTSHTDIFLLTAPILTTLILLMLTTFFTYNYFYDTNEPKQPVSTLKISNLKNAFKEATAAGHIRRLFIIFFLYELGWSVYYQDISLYLTQRYHYSVTDMSYFMAYTGIWMALGLAVIYKPLLKRFSLSAVLNASLLFCVLSFAACAISTQSFWQWIFIIPGAIAVGTIYPTIMALISDQVSSSKQGWVLGFAAASFAAPWGISALIIGPMTNLHLTLPLYTAAFLFISAYMLTIKSRAPTSDIQTASP